MHPHLNARRPAPGVLRLNSEAVSASPLITLQPLLTRSSQRVSFKESRFPQLSPTPAQQSTHRRRSCGGRSPTRSRAKLQLQLDTPKFRHSLYKEFNRLKCQALRCAFCRRVLCSCPNSEVTRNVRELHHKREQLFNDCVTELTSKGAAASMLTILRNRAHSQNSRKVATSKALELNLIKFF